MVDLWVRVQPLFDLCQAAGIDDTVKLRRPDKNKFFVTHEVLRCSEVDLIKIVDPRVEVCTAHGYQTCAVQTSSYFNRAFHLLSPDDQRHN